MDMRAFQNALKRLKAMAGETPISGHDVSKLIQPFVDEWRTVPTPNKADAPPADGAAMPLPYPAQLTLAPPHLQDLAVRIKTIGMNLVKARLAGIRFHNAFQLHVAHLANQFDCRGWTESAATFMDPDEPDTQTTSHGRIDVIWARSRLPVAIFEIDSTVKPRSFQKLKEGLAAHKFWIYFGKDIWGFKSFLLQEDPTHEITPIIIPNTFTPSFSEPVTLTPPIILPRVTPN